MPYNVGMRGLTLGLVTIALLGGSGALGYALWRPDDGQASYRTAKVERGDITAAVSASGTVAPVVTVQVGSQVSGNILALFADFNTRVAKGQLIARIDPAPFQTRVNQAQASLDAARAAVVNSHALVQQSLAGIQAARSTLAAVHANVAKAGALVEDARVKVDRRVIMVGQGADPAEDLETARTTYQSELADRTAVEAQEQAAEDTVKVAEAQFNVANAQVATSQAQVSQAAAALQAA